MDGPVSRLAADLDLAQAVGDAEEAGVAGQRLAACSTARIWLGRLYSSTLSRVGSNSPWACRIG